jgi:hypothetical protein
MSVSAPTSEIGDKERAYQERVQLQMRANRARRWIEGAWRDLEGMIVDMSARGVGLSLNNEVRLGDRVSLTLPIQDDGGDLRVTVEIRHVRPRASSGHWRAGGLFRNLPPDDHERILRFIQTASSTSRSFPAPPRNRSAA